MEKHQVPLTSIMFPIHLIHALHIHRLCDMPAQALRVVQVVGIAF